MISILAVMDFLKSCLSKNPSLLVQEFQMEYYVSFLAQEVAKILEEHIIAAHSRCFMLAYFTSYRSKWVYPFIPRVYLCTNKSAEKKFFFLQTKYLKMVQTHCIHSFDL